jgi:hypothetical protein
MALEKKIIMKQTHGDDDITPDMKKVAESIALTCEEFGSQFLADTIRTQYKLKHIERYNMEKNSIFYNFAKVNKINVKQQGWIKENNIMYPLVAIDEDIRKLDNLVKKIISESKN